jgi:hypothetical protein
MAIGLVSPPRRSPLMELRSASASLATVEPYWLSSPSTPFSGYATSFDRPARLRPTGPAEPRGVSATSPRTLSGPGDTRAVAPPSEYDHRTPPRLVSALAALELAWFLPGLWPPSAPSDRESHVRSAGSSTSLLRSASRVSHPLDGLTPPRTLPTCFIRLALLGLHPTELSSPLAAVAPLGARCRPGVHHRSRSNPTAHHPPARSMGDTGFRCTFRDRTGPVIHLHGLAPPEGPPLRRARFRRSAGT